MLFKKAVQSALIPMGTTDLRWNMYTTAGWLAASLTLVQVILFLPCIFQEFNMAEKEANWNKMINLKKNKENQGLVYRSSNLKFPVLHLTNNWMIHL